MASPEPIPENRSVLSELLSRRRLVLVAVVLFVEVAIFLAGLLTPMSPSTQQSLANSTGGAFGIVQTGTPAQLVAFIFAHNLLIALVEMVPVLGALLFVFSIYSTGLVAQALVVSQGQPAQLGAAILVFPYSLVELSAYALAVGAGIMLLLSWRRKRLRREIRIFVLEGLGVVAILFLAAVMETTTIKISPLLGLALWVPTGIALAGIIVISERMRV